MAAHPKRPAAALVPALGHEVEVLIVDIQRLDAPRIGRVGVKYAARRVLEEYADALALRSLRILPRVVVKRFLLGQFIRRERHAVVAIEVGVGRGDPLETP